MHIASRVSLFSIAAQVVTSLTPDDLASGSNEFVSFVMSNGHALTQAFQGALHQRIEDEESQRKDMSGLAQMVTFYHPNRVTVVGGNTTL